MKGDIRREGIVERLMKSDAPVPAKLLSEEFGVSRQIIVKDIALLKQKGFPISALSRGYVIDKKQYVKKVFKIIHTEDEVQKELNLIVDLGGCVEDVFIYHKCYNKVSAKLCIKSRLDVERFLENIKSGKSSLLMNVTAGYHYHTVSAEDENTLLIIENELKNKGFLAPLQEYEPEEIKRGEVK